MKSFQQNWQVFTFHAPRCPIFNKLFANRPCHKFCLPFVGKMHLFFVGRLPQLSKDFSGSRSTNNTSVICILSAKPHSRLVIDLKTQVVAISHFLRQRQKFSNVQQDGQRRWTNESRISDATRCIAYETISKGSKQNNQDFGTKVLLNTQFSRWHNGASGSDLQLHGKAQQLPKLLQRRSQSSQTHPQGVQDAYLWGLPPQNWQTIHLPKVQGVTFHIVPLLVQGAQKVSR